MVKNNIISPSFSIRYRQAFADMINGNNLDNTGGAWVNIIPAIGWHLNQFTVLTVIPEIPVYSRVEGIQLTPTFRFQAGLYHSFGDRKSMNLIKNKRWKSN